MGHKARIWQAIARYENKREADRISGAGDEEAAAAMTPKKPKRGKSSSPGEWTEHQAQCAIASLLNRLGLLWCHVPNEGKRSAVAGARLRAAGLKSGCPDILLFSPAPNKPEARGVAIELKREKGGRISEAQKEWIWRLNEAGWYATVCHGYDAAINELEELGYIKNKGEAGGKRGKKTKPPGTK
jgi:hypothetical protein